MAGSKKIEALIFITLIFLFIPASVALAIQDNTDENIIESEEKQYPDHLKSKVEIIEYDLNRPLKGFLGEEGKVRIGGDMIYGTGDGANQVYSPQVSIGLQGNISEHNFFLFDVNVAKDFSRNIENNLMNITIRNDSIKNNKIYIGRMRPEVGIDGAKSSYFLPMINRSQIGRTFGSARDYGIKVDGNYKYAEYSLGVFNGTRDTLRRNPGRPDFTGMVIFKPLNSEQYGKLAIGGGCSTGKRYHDYTVLTSYAKYSYKNFDIESEYMHANGYNGEIHSPDRAQGFYIMPTYHLGENVEILARYDFIDPNIHIDDNNSKEYSVGINYYLANKRIRLSTNYVYADTPNGNSNRVLFMTQFRP